MPHIHKQGQATIACPHCHTQMFFASIPTSCTIVTFSICQKCSFTVLDFDASPHAAPDTTTTTLHVHPNGQLLSATRNAKCTPVKIPPMPTPMQVAQQLGVTPEAASAMFGSSNRRNANSNGKGKKSDA